MSENKSMFGIDLGTTNSAISIMVGSDKLVPNIIQLSSGRNTLPSCVMWTKKDGFTVGYDAYQQRYKSNVVYSIKRYMGSNHLTTLIDEEGNTITLTPEEVSAEVIKELVAEAKKVGYGDVYNVTITVPAYFDDKQRKATIKAGELAGLNVVSIVNEPTAASLAYGLDKSPQLGNVLVYDLGGGTFDASLLKIEHTGIKKKIGMIKLIESTKEQSVVSVLSNGGNNKLGGDDIDVITVKKICKELDELLASKGHEVDSFNLLPEDEIEKIILQVEKLKKNSAGTIPILNVDATLTNGIAVQESIPFRNKYLQEATQEVFNQTIVSVNECLKTSPDKTFTKVVLVGGSTKSEMIRQLVTAYFDKQQVYYGLNPDESVSLGAAVMTSIAMGGSDIKLFDVIPLPIGIQANDQRADGTTRKDVFNKVIQKDSQLPAKGIFYATNSQDNGAGIDIEIYQGTKRKASENVLIGMVEIEELPKKPVGEVKIEVHLLVDLNGVLSVKVIIDGVAYNKTFSSVFGKSEESKLSPEEQLLALQKQLGNDVEVTAVGKDLTTVKYDKVDYKFGKVYLTDNPKVKRWLSNLDNWGVSDLDKKEAKEKLKSYEEGKVEEKEIIKLLKDLRSKYVKKRLN